MGRRFSDPLNLLPFGDMTDAAYHRLFFRRIHHRPPDVSLTLNDVLYRMKTSDEILEPLRVFVSDKEYVKLYVRAMVGERYNVPTLAVLRTEKDVRTFPYPSQCCIKPTHASSRVILRQAGEALDLDKIVSWLSLNYYRHGFRERNYRTLVPKIIVEPLLAMSLGELDHKVFCWNGEPRIIQSGLRLKTEDRRRYFTPDWSEITDRPAEPLKPPRQLAEMLEVAAKLSKPFSLVRIDFYVTASSLLVGEITNCHWGGHDRFRNPAFEQRLSAILFGSGASTAPPAIVENAEPHPASEFRRKLRR